MRPNRLDLQAESTFDYTIGQYGLLQDLQLLQYCVQHPRSFQIQTPELTCFAIPPGGKCQFEVQRGSLVSFMPFGGQARNVTTHGLYWELRCDD